MAADGAGGRVSEPRTPEKKRGYASGRARKLEIVEHAAAAFAQKGFYGTSLREIAREVGVHHTVLMHHFGAKAELLVAVIDWYDTRHGSLKPQFAGLGQVLVTAIVAAAEKNAETPGLVRLLSVLTAEAGEPDHPAREALQTRHERLKEIFAAALRERDAEARHAPEKQHEPGVSPGLSPEDRAVLMIAVWEGLQVFEALSPTPIDLPTLLGEAIRRII